MLLLLLRSTAGAGAITGALVATESGTDTAAITGNVVLRGALAATESGSDTAAFTGDVVVQGALVASEEPDTFAAVGTTYPVITIAGIIRITAVDGGIRIASLDGARISSVDGIRIS